MCTREAESWIGYFSLKLATLVRRQGEVVAVDLQRVKLFFLRIRAWMRGLHNIGIVVAMPTIPGPTEWN